MIRAVVRSSIRARGLVLLLAFLASVGGIVVLQHAKVDSLPEFGPPTVEVRTEALGLSAPEVEQLITVPMEQDLLDGVGWLAAIRSASLPGLSSIELVFEPGTNLLHARQLVQERLAQSVALPNVSQPPQMLQPASSTSRVEMIGLSSKTLTPIQMSVLAWWTMRPRLLGVRGVANVSIWGLRDRQLQVQVDPKRLGDSHVTLQQILDTTGNALWASPLTFLEANTPGTGGFIDTPNQRLSVQHQQPITRATDLAAIPIEGTSGARLQDVANVVEDHQPLIGDAILSHGPGLLVVVEKSPGANTLDVTRGVESMLRTLRPGLKGMAVDPSVYRPATFIEHSAHNFRTYLALGFVLMLLALGIGLFAFAEIAATVAGIVVALLASALVLYARGVTFDLTIFAGIFLAVAFIVIDQCSAVRRVEPDLIPTTVGDSRATVVFVALAAVIAAWPLLVLRGAAGAFFPRIVGAYLLGVGASVVVGTIFTPVLCFVLLRRTNHRVRTERPARTIASVPRAVAVCAVLVIVGAATLPFMSTRFLPSFRDSAVLVRWNAASGTSLPEMDRVTRRAAAELRRIRGVASVGANIGRAALSDETAAVDSAELWVNLDPHANHDRTVQRIRAVVDGYPGIAHHIVTYPNERLDTVFKQPDTPVVVRLYGEDPKVLGTLAENLRRGLSHIKGIASPRIEQQAAEPTVHVEVNLTAAEQAGIKPGDVRRAAATMFQGIAVGSLFQDQKIFDVVVWSVPTARRTLTDIRNLEIDTPSGGRVRLGDVADVRVAPTPSAITHEDISRKLDVTAAVRGRTAAAVNADVARLVHQTRYPLEYHAEVIPRPSMHRGQFVVVLLSAALGLVLLLQGATRSWKVALSLAATLPVVLAGGLISDVILARTLSAGAIAGLVGVAGIAVYHGVTLFRGADRTLVVGTLAAILCCVPIAFGRTTPGLEIAQPMAAVLVGGLLTSLVSTRYLLPLLFERYGPVEASSDVAIASEIVGAE